MLTGALTGSQQCDVVTLRGKARDSDDVLQQSHPAGDRPPSKITMLVPVGSEFTFTDVVPDSFFTSVIPSDKQHQRINNRKCDIGRKKTWCFMDAAQLTGALSL